ncbi:MAG: Na+/H+ antiporter subunit D [Actinomycetota bacterium]|nr:Na+/H+ antiporter subunit D [Actinomycetota bacterium]
MSLLLPLPAVLPLIAAGLSLALSRLPNVQRTLGVVSLSAATASAIAVLVHVQDNGPVAIDVGAWPAGIGITLVADVFAALLLVISSIVLLVVLVYAIGQPGTDDGVRFFHPVYLVLAAGVSLAYLTGDLFNLFVAVEVMLMASYVLITLGGNARQVRSGMTYVVINLLASTALVATIGIVYAATGTVNLADLASRLDEIPGPVQLALGAMLFVVFGIKAGIFPLFFWLPDAYPTAPTAVTAIFAGLLTKVGVYAIIRTQTLLFPSDGPSTVLLVVAALTMVIGVLGAIAQDDVKRILSFHIISQIGYMIMGLALFSVAGLAGAVFYIVHHIPVKTGLFLITGLIEQTTGTGALRRLGGMVRSAPVIAALFAIPGLSLAGIPPFSGFIAKLALVDAGLADDQSVIVAISLAVSLLTLFSMAKVWAGVFWGQPDEPPPLAAATNGNGDGSSTLSLPHTMVGATAAIGAVVLAVSFGAGIVWDLSMDAAVGLTDTSGYRIAVLGVAP